MKLSLACISVMQGLALQSSVAWTPGVGSPTAADGFTVDTANRRDTLAFYQCAYLASETYAADMAWTGNTTTWVAGDTSEVFKNHVRRRINFYRALAGLPGDITFNPTKCTKDQQAALMFARNNNAIHNPPSSWLSYTADGAEAAANSNVTLAYYGPPAINSYMQEPGGNVTAGHRRWLLYSRAKDMGTGDIPPGSSNYATNATWVIGDFKTSPTPTFVKWPNAGYSPITLMPPKWSLSYPSANFASATVTMTRDGANVPLTVVSKTDNGQGDNTIVWEPTGLPTTAATDITYQVNVSGITGASSTSHSYSVILFDPDRLNEEVTITGSATPPAFSSNHQFNAIEQADGYTLMVGKPTAATWTEGAEDSTATLITSTISSGYTLRQTTRKRTGSRAFQLTFPSQYSISDQGFSLIRNIIPTASSNLLFHQLSQATGATDTLNAQVSPDGGNQWTTVWSRTGTNGSTSQTTFQSTSVSLASYAGKIIKLRFLMKYNGGATYVGTTSIYGFFIDDISVTNATEIASPTLTTLPATATSFQLNSITAGGSLLTGTTYHLAIRPSVGLHGFPYGPLKTVVPQTPTGYDAWVANSYPTVTDGPMADPENDGLVNAVEYAFALDPLTSNSSAELPQPVAGGDSITFTFTTPVGVTGVTYGIQWSENLIDWNNITDTGIGSLHVFQINKTGKNTLFFRHRAVISP